MSDSLGGVALILILCVPGDSVLLDVQRDGVLLDFKRDGVLLDARL